MAKITAIVSAYYAAEYLAGRIENLLEQDAAPEIAVVCAKGSEEYLIARRYFEQGFEGQVFTVHPAGDGVPTVYAAWNMAIAHAGGEYLTNANSDDRLYPGALSKMAAALDTNPEYVTAYGDTDIVKVIGGAPVGRYTWAEGGLDVLYRLGCFMGPFPMWRRSVHDKYGLFDAEMTSAGDYEFWLRLAAGGEKFYKIHEPLGAYLDHKASAGHRSPIRTTWEHARARARYKPAGVL